MCITVEIIRIMLAGFYLSIQYDSQFMLLKILFHDSE